MVMMRNDECSIGSIIKRIFHPKQITLLATILARMVWIGKSTTYDVRQLNSQRGLSPTIQGHNAMTVATGLVPDHRDGTPSSIRALDLSKKYGYGNPKHNLTGMNPRNLGVLNYDLYNAPDRYIKPTSESGRILYAEHEKATSLASRIKRVGGTVR